MPPPTMFFLMVSHSVGTIIEHCTRAVWIEKGLLQMDGEPKEVCEAYKKAFDGYVVSTAFNDVTMGYYND